MPKAKLAYDHVTHLAEIISPPKKKQPVLKTENNFLNREARALIRYVKDNLKSLPNQEIATAFNTNPAAVQKVISNTYNGMVKKDKLREDKHYLKSDLFNRIKTWVNQVLDVQKEAHRTSVKREFKAEKDSDSDYEDTEKDDEEDIGYNTPTKTPNLKIVFKSTLPDTRGKTPKAALHDVKESLFSPIVAAPAIQSKKRKAGTPATAPAKRPRVSSIRAKTPAPTNMELALKGERAIVSAFFKAQQYKSSYLKSLLELGLGPKELLALRNMDQNTIVEILSQLPVDLVEYPVKLGFLAHAIASASDEVWDMLAQEDDSEEDN
ncbi:hypothetical protein BDZ97DRAFT_1919739 [Flammula alnicola]|nr:hypothetical protein BDZ97DRAFT_1919739 [Flammula alnicola]